MIAISANTRELAERTAGEWRLSKLPIGYGMSIDDARRWGLFVSRGVKDSEPAEFFEPALMVVRPDGTLYASAVQTMPFARPATQDLLRSLDWIVANDYPARGEA